MGLGKWDMRLEDDLVRVKITFDHAQMKRLDNAQLQVCGTLRVIAGDAEAHDPGVTQSLAASSNVSITVQGELIGHHFFYNPVTGAAHVHQQSAAISCMATLCDTPLPSSGTTLPIDVTIPVPESPSSQRTAWELRLAALQGEVLLSYPVSIWLGQPQHPAAWEGFLQNETSDHTELAPSVVMHHIQGHLPEGPVEMWLLTVDVTDPHVHVDALHADQPYPEETARWPRSVVSHMLAAAKGLIGINASLFEIKTTMNPRGMRIQDGQPLKSGNPGWQASVGFTRAGTPYFGSWQLNSGMRRADGTGYRTIATFSTTGTGADQLGLFGWPWTQSPGYDPMLDEATPVVELVVAKLSDRDSADCTAALPGELPKTTRSMLAQVKEIRRQQPGITIEQGTFVLTGYGEAAQYLLDTYRVGDQVEILYAVTGETAWPGLVDWRELNAVVSGNMLLLRNGGYGDARVLRLPERHPHTAVAATCDQRTLYWLVVDGRSERSIGMTYKELADFFLYIGAFNAINCDGGGSTTLAVRDRQTEQVTVVNAPSDGEQRPVPDGLVIRWSDDDR